MFSIFLLRTIYLVAKCLRFVFVFLKKFNKELKILAKLSGVENPDTITSYVIRHSWGTIMRKLGYSDSQIGEGYKHGDEKVTKIYLYDIGNSKVDDMNRTLLNL